MAQPCQISAGSQEPEIPSPSDFQRTVGTSTGTRTSIEVLFYLRTISSVAHLLAPLPQDWVRIRPRIARLDARRAELLLSRCKTNVSWTTQREGLPVMKKNTLIAALLGLADGLAAGVVGRSPGHQRHDCRHRHGRERRGAARRHRHGPQRGHRFHPHRAGQRCRRLSSRVPAHRPVCRGGQPLRIQDGGPQRHRPERQRHRPRGRRPVARRRRRDGECRGRTDRDQHDHLGDLADHRRRRDPEPADRRPQRLLAARPHARRAVQQQRRRVRLGRHQLARARLPRTAHADQRRRRRRHRLGELLPRRRHQHDGVAQHRQHPAQPGRHSGIQGPDQQLQRGVRAFRQRRHQRHHEGRHQRVQRIGLRVPARRIAERQGLGLPARQAAAQPQSVRRHPRRPDRTQQDLLFRLLLGTAADDQHLPEHRHRADRARADGKFQCLQHAARRPGDRADVCLQRRHRRHLP